MEPEPQPEKLPNVVSDVYVPPANRSGAYVPPGARSRGGGAYVPPGKRGQGSAKANKTPPDLRSAVAFPSLQDTAKKGEGR